MTKTETLHQDARRAYRIYRSAPSRNYAAYRAAMDAIGAHAVEVMAALTDAGIHTHVAHAYTPNEAGSYGGSDHIVIDAGYVRNRMVGDALCKPAKKFWQLLRSDTGSPSCKTCIERAEKLVTQLVKQKIARDLRAEDEP